MLPSLIEERIGTPVEVFNPFTKIEYNMNEYSPEYIKEVGPLAAVAVGLALRKEDVK
jgi:type IV pilus assembly protein PilM